MTLTQERKAEITTQFGANAQDTGNTRVQVALLSERINELTEHLRDAQEGPPLPPRAADARRPSPPAAQLPAEEGPRGLPRADPRARPSSVSIVAPGTPAPEFSLKRADGDALHPRGPARADDRPRLLPVRLQPGLHRPAADLRGGAGRAARAGRDALRRLLRRDVLADGVQAAARRLDRAAQRLRAQGRRVAGLRRLLRARRHVEPRARDRRARRGRASGRTWPTTPASCRAST